MHANNTDTGGFTGTTLEFNSVNIGVTFLSVLLFTT